MFIMKLMPVLIVIIFQVHNSTSTIIVKPTSSYYNVRNYALSNSMKGPHKNQLHTNKSMNLETLQNYEKQAFKLNKRHSLYDEHKEDRHSIVGTCECIPNRVCKLEAFVRMKNPSICFAPGDILCCAFIDESNDGNNMRQKPKATPIMKPMYASFNTFKNDREQQDSLNTIKTETEKQEIFSRCGHQSFEGLYYEGLRDTLPKINSTYQAKLGEFPWMVAILLQHTLVSTEEVNVFQCGGSLIHPQVVLTAAHCVEVNWHDAKLKVRTGEWNISINGIPYERQDRLVQNIVIHPKYNRLTKFNDIAVLILETPVELNDYTIPVCLPTELYHPEDYEKDCLLTGWGKISLESNYSDVLKYVPLLIISNGKCIQKLKTQVGGQGEKLHDSFLCTKRKNDLDQCEGDDGGPLVCRKNNSSYYVQVGIAIWNHNCGADETPSLVTKVETFLPWIQHILSKFV